MAKCQNKNYFATMNDVCPKCPDETHFYCKRLVIRLFIDMLDSGKAQKAKLRCGEEVEVRLV